MKMVLASIFFMYISLISLHGGKIYSSTEFTKQKNQEEAIKFIKDVVNKALETINDDSLSSSQKRQKLSEYVNKFLDIDRIARAVFSRWGYKTLSLADQDKVKAYLKQYLIYFYAGAGKLSPMMNASLLSDLVAKSRGEDFAVTTQFTKNYSSTTKIIWVTDGQKIYYVEIEGINQIITLRSEMQAAIGSRTLMNYVNKHLNE